LGTNFIAMDYEKKIKALLSENEFLQEQLEDLNNEIRKKDAEIFLLGDGAESEASLRSRIEGNLIEIQQLKYNSEKAAQKSAAMEILNEALELDLYKEIKERQKGQAVIKELVSTNTNIDILTNELNEAAALYKKVQSLKKELAEAKSIAEIKTIENNHLLDEVEELRALLKELRLSKGQNK
jgi:catechol-2,3-dioxygenase